MLGWHSAVHGEGNVAFSSSNNSNNNNGMALPLARRHELATPLPSVAANPSTVSASSSSSSCTESWPSSVQWLRSPLSAFRKRPGCLVDAHPHPTRSLDQDCRSGSGDRCGREDQPLDLTVPKLKVRQHWSGGCIVQVNDKAEAAATATTRVATADATCNYCCASNCPSVAAGQADSQLIVTLQTSNSAFRPSLNETCCIHKGCAGAEGLSSDRPFVPLTSWPFAPRYEQESASEEPFWAETLAETRRQVSHQQRPTQLFWDSAGSNGLLQRLQVQVRIPHQPPSAGHTPTDQLTAVVPDKIVQFLRTTRPRKPAAASPASAAGLPAAAIPQPLRPLEATPAPVDSHLAMDDDLRRLTQCLHHLQSSGYYYGNLSWKESIQLLQGTAVSSLTKFEYLYSTGELKVGRDVTFSGREGSEWRRYVDPSGASYEISLGLFCDFGRATTLADLLVMLLSR